MAPNGGNFGPIEFDWDKAMNRISEAIAADEVVPFRVIMAEELNMEKNAEIREDVTPAEKTECCKEAECKELEDHVTKRAADKASGCCKDNDKCC